MCGAEQGQLQQSLSSWTSRVYRALWQKLLQAAYKHPVRRSGDLGLCKVLFALF